MKLKRLSTQDGNDGEDDGVKASESITSHIHVTAASTEEIAQEQQRTAERKMSDKQQEPPAGGSSIILPGPANNEKKAVTFGWTPDIIDDNQAPVPVSQTTHARKDTKQNKGLEVLGSNAPQPFDVAAQDDPTLTEKQKLKTNDQALSGGAVIKASTEEDTRAASQALGESISHPCIDEESQVVSTRLGSVDRLTSRRTQVTAQTAATALSGETIFDAYSQRASTVRYTDGGDIFIPEATLVEEPMKEDIPSAEIVEPERYSVTVAGKKINIAGVFGLVALVIIILAVALSVSMTRSPPTSMVPTSPPTTPPSSSPTTQFYSSLVQRIYGGGIEQKDLDQDRQAAMSWIEQDQASASVSLSDEQLRERYALALLFFVTNANGNWYDSINFLSEDHVCTWRIKRSGEKKGILLCDEDERVQQLVIYANSLEGEIPMELKFLTELKVLKLDSNRMGSTLPNAIGSLSKLDELVLYNNAFSGNVPKSFSSLHNLTTMHLSDNKLQGPLLDVGKMTNLRTFRVDGNKISGSIPESFGDLYLDTFHINRNSIMSSMDFMCNQLPYDYKMDCYGNEPEVTCNCCIGCTIISDDECEENEEIAFITVSSGKYDDAFDWQLYMQQTNEFGWQIDSLMAAGGEYYANDEISFQLCLGYPRRYYFLTNTNVNSTSDASGAGIEVSVSESDFAVGPQEIFTFELSNDGSFESVITTSPPVSSSTDDMYIEDFDGSSGMLESIIYGNEKGACINFEMELRTDYFGDETSWDIVNTIDESVVRSVDRGSYGGNTTYYEYDCLDSSGCYNFTIYDQWHDGICCSSGDGYFKISSNDRFLHQGGEFKGSDSVFIGGSCSAVVPKSGTCPNNQSQINVTIQTDANSFEMSWEVYDKATGQIYCLNSDQMEANALYITQHCIPNDKCMVFSIKDSAGNGFNETSDGFYEVTYNDELVASGAGDFGYKQTTNFGTGCR